MKKIFMFFLMCLIISWSLPAVGVEEVSHRLVKITVIEGEVLVRLADTDKWIKAKKDMILTQEDEIKTGSTGSATIIFDEKGSFSARDYDSIDIAKDTELVFNKLLYDKQKNIKTTLLQLNVGKIIANAAKLKGGSKFEVETPTALVGVRGTNYVVEYREKE